MRQVSDDSSPAKRDTGVSTFPVVGLAHTFKVCVFGRPGTLADLKVCASRVAGRKCINSRVPRSGTPSSRRCKPTDADPGKPFRPWRGRPLQEPTPPGLIGFCRLLSVGCTYGYLWTDPSHIQRPLLLCRATNDYRANTVSGTSGLRCCGAYPC